MPNPLFTVVTVTYNSSRWIRQAIESVLASSFTDFEYIISDDCSHDDTWLIVNEYKDPRIRVWRNEKNLGEYPNRNKVLKQAKGKFILYIDGDDILYKDALLEYAKYLEAFPTAKGVWGVYPLYFDFVVFPYMFSPFELTSLNFLSTYPVTVIGFTDTVFDIDALRQIGGFDDRFAIGDTFIKRKFSCYYPVVLVPAGRAFWRQYPEQASNRVRKAYRQLLETLLIDKELLQAEYFPLTGQEKGQALLNYKIRSIKLIALNTIRKNKFLDFFRLLKLMSIPLSHIRYLFKKGDYSYKAGATSSAPLFNHYNFK